MGCCASAPADHHDVKRRDRSSSRGGDHSGSSRDLHSDGNGGERLRREGSARRGHGGGRSRSSGNSGRFLSSDDLFANIAAPADGVYDRVPSIPGSPASVPNNNNRPPVIYDRFFPPDPVPPSPVVSPASKRGGSRVGRSPVKSMKEVSSDNLLSAVSGYAGAHGSRLGNRRSPLRSKETSQNDLPPPPSMLMDTSSPSGRYRAHAEASPTSRAILRERSFAKERSFRAKASPFQRDKSMRGNARHGAPTRGSPAPVQQRMRSHRQPNDDVLMPDANPYAHLRHERWFEESLTREDAAAFLADRGVGAFVLRPSSKIGFVALTWKPNRNEVVHCKICIRDCRHDMVGIAAMGGPCAAYVYTMEEQLSPVYKTMTALLLAQNQLNMNA